MKITVEIRIEPDFLTTDGNPEGVGMTARTERLCVSPRGVPAATWKAVCDASEAVAGAFDPDREAFDPLAQFGESKPDND